MDEFNSFDHEELFEKINYDESDLRQLEEIEKLNPPALNTSGFDE